MGLVLSRFGAGIREPVTTTSCGAGDSLASCANAVAEAAVVTAILSRSRARTNRAIVSFLGIGFTPEERQLVLGKNDRRGARTRLPSPQLLRFVRGTPFFNENMGL